MPRFPLKWPKSRARVSGMRRGACCGGPQRLSTRSRLQGERMKNQQRVPRPGRRFPVRWLSFGLLLMLVLFAWRPRKDARVAAPAARPEADATVELPSVEPTSAAKVTRARPRRSARLVVAAAAIVVLMGVGVTGAFGRFERDTTVRAAQATTSNLLTNPGAESGDGATDSSAHPAVPGWTTTDDFTAVRYGTSGGFPSLATGDAIGGGANLFAGGPSSAASTAVQTVNVADRSEAIDGGLVTANLSAFIGGFE